MKFKSKPVQLVRHMHEVMNGYNKAVKAGVKHMVQIKEDGVFAFFIFNELSGIWQAYGRTGKRLTNLECIEDELHALCVNTSYVWIAEICDDVMSLEELSACISPNRKKPIEIDFNPVARLHDSIQFEHFVDGYSKAPAEKRYRRVQDEFKEVNSKYLSIIPTVFDKTFDEINLIAEGVILKGKEGIVVKEQDCDWKAGRKNHTSMKVVRGCDYDLKCIRVEQGEGKRANMVANAICVWRKYGESDGELMELPIDLGKGFTDEKRVELWLNQDLIVGKIVEVKALQIGSKGSLRLPKVNSIRIDKEEADFG